MGRISVASLALSKRRSVQSELPGWFCLWTAAACVLPFALPAASITLLPVADATLIQVAPSNSMGGAEFFNAGTTQNGTRNRALMQFDVAAAIPPGSRISGAGLWLSVTHQPDEPPAESTFTLRRVLRPWGEGTNA